VNGVHAAVDNALQDVEIKSGDVCEDINEQGQRNDTQSISLKEQGMATGQGTSVSSVSSGE
jgi:hypothetical protein